MMPDEPDILIDEPAIAEPFVMVPKRLYADKGLSPGAKMTYGMLLCYAWYENAVFPGQARLAEDMGCAERSVRTYLKELADAGWLEIKQRGLGQSNLYRLRAWIRPAANFAVQDRQKTAVLDRQPRSGQDRQTLPGKETKLKRDEEEGSGSNPTLKRYQRGRYGHVVKMTEDD